MVAPAAEPDAGTSENSMAELLQLAAQAESLLRDTSALFDGVQVRQRVGAVAGLLRDAAQALAAADADVAATRAEAARVATRAEEEVARLWRTVSADIATRRAGTDAFVARVRERAEREADARLADASAKADLLLARTEELVASWLDEANAEVARILESAPALVEVSVLPAPEPAAPRRRRFLSWLRRRP